MPVDLEAELVVRVVVAAGNSRTSRAAGRRRAPARQTMSSRRVLGRGSGCDRPSGKSVAIGDARAGSRAASPTSSPSASSTLGSQPRTIASSLRSSAAASGVGALGVDVERVADQGEVAVAEIDRPVGDLAARAACSIISPIATRRRGGELVARQPDEGEQMALEDRADQDQRRPRPVGERHGGGDEMLAPPRAAG